MDEMLPKLQYKQQKFVIRYSQNGEDQNEAYRYAYNCENMSKEAVSVEASRMLKNPKVSLWIERYRKNIQEYIDTEINYSVADAFLELDELKQIALNSFDKSGNPKIADALRAVENKCKIKGLYKDRVEVSGGAIVKMGSVEVDGSELNLKIGQEIENKAS